MSRDSKNVDLTHGNCQIMEIKIVVSSRIINKNQIFVGFGLLIVIGRIPDSNSCFAISVVS